MSKQIQRRRGSTADHATFTGAQGELTYNTDTKRVHAHDGLTAGGFAAARVDELASTGGSALVGYDGQTVQDVLDGAKSLQDYVSLRAYTGRANRIYVTGLLTTAKPAGISGFFQYDPADSTSTDNGGTIIVGTDGRRWKRKFESPISPLWFMSQAQINDCVSFAGTLDVTTSFTSALTAAQNTTGEIFVPAGKFRGNFIFDGKVRVRCAGRENTTFVAQSTTSPIVKVYGERFADVSGFTVDCENAAVTGLQLGDRALFGFEYGNVSKIYVIRSSTFGIDMQAATGCALDDVYSYNHSSGYAFNIPAAANVQVVTFNQCRFRLSARGASLSSGNRLTFINCIIESNLVTGLYMIREGTSGPAHLDFIDCWFENNGINGTVGDKYSSSILLDVVSAEATTNWQNIKFTRCIVTSNANAFDVFAVRSIDVEFDRCSFTAKNSGGFTSSKFGFSETGRAIVILNQCGSLNEQPNPTMYSAMPALTTATGGQLSDSALATQGFQYTYEWRGRTYSNKRPYGVAGAVVGVKTPTRDGEEVFDSTNSVWYRAVGSTINDWRPVARINAVNSSLAGDADVTLTAGVSGSIFYAAAPMTGNRQITLSTTGAWNGAEFHITRAAASTGAFSLNVGALKSLSPGTWCRVVFDGSAWLLVAAGSL